MGGSPRERSVRPRCRRGGRCRGAGRGPVQACLTKVSSAWLVWESRAPRKGPTLLGGGAVCLESQQATPPPQFPHLESHMLVPSSGLPEPEGAHTEGDRSLWLECISRRIRGLPETTCSGRRWATPLPLSTDVQIGDKGVFQSSPLSVPEAGPLGRGLPRHPLPREEGQ